MSSKINLLSSTKSSNVKCKSYKKFINKHINRITMLQKLIDIEEQKLMKLLQQEQEQEQEQL